MISFAGVYVTNDLRSTALRHEGIPTVADLAVVAAAEWANARRFPNMVFLRVSEASRAWEVWTKAQGDANALSSSAPKPPSQGDALQV